MKRYRGFAFGLSLLLVIGLGSTPAPAQTATELQGQVVAEVDPFLLFRNLARIDEEGFAELAETLILDSLDGLLEQVEIPEDSVPSWAKGFAEYFVDTYAPQIADQVSQEIICRGREKPEAYVDILESLPFDRELLDEFLVLDRETILALIPDLPGDLSNLLGTLLPSTIDLTQLPMAGATVAALNNRGWPLAAVVANKEGEFSLRLPSGTDRLRISKIGYQTSVVPLGEALAAGGRLALVPNDGTLRGRVNGPPNRILAGAGARAPVQVATADGEPTTQANFLGMYSLSGIKPLLPGLFGGIGLHTAVVDVPGYELERENVLFLASNATKNFQLREAALIGDLTGRVTARPFSLDPFCLLIFCLDVDPIVADLFDDLFGEGNAEVVKELLFAPRSVAGADVETASGAYAGTTDECGRYRIEDIPAGPNYEVDFAKTPNERSEEGVEIKAGRTTELDVCLDNGRLSGQLNFASGLKRGRVQLRRSGITVAEQATNSTGAYDFGAFSLSTGDYDVRIQQCTGTFLGACTGYANRVTLPGQQSIDACATSTLNLNCAQVSGTWNCTPQP
jgi:hypothetical protein